MEIHAPEKPILTVKEAAVHLLIVTVGILIALSLEGIVEYVHHRMVVREARDIMHREIEENRGELDKALAHIRDSQLKEMRQDIDVILALTAKKTSDGSLNFSYRGANLGSGGRAAAQLMGAFAYMDYQEVRQWATVYDIQEAFLRQQSTATSEATPAFSFLVKRDLATTPTAQLETEADNVRRAFSALVSLSQFGQYLRVQYDKVLTAK